jgi:hypothetical protein
MPAYCNTRGSRTLGLLLIFLWIAGPLQGQVRAAVYSAELDVNLFGYLNQNDIPIIGSFASAPAASVNAYVYLQNRYPGIYGTSLAGTTMSQWIQTAERLAQAQYMATADNGTTFIRDQIYGNTTYLNDTVPDLNRFAGQAVLSDGVDWTQARPQPPFIQRVFPTWQSLYFAILQQNAIVIDLYFPGTIRPTHTVTGTSFHWNDIDGDGFIDLSENAEIDFIDPLDPAGPPEPPSNNRRPKRRFGRIYEEILGVGGPFGDRRLRFSYSDSGVFLRSETDGFITSAFYVLEPVPEPSTMVVFAIGLVALRFRSFKRS